jgi:hypothetical protein
MWNVLSLLVLASVIAGTLTITTTTELATTTAPMMILLSTSTPPPATAGKCAAGTKAPITAVLQGNLECENESDRIIGNYRTIGTYISSDEVLFYNQNTGVKYNYDVLKHTVSSETLWFSPNFGGRWQIGFPYVKAYINGYQSVWQLNNAPGWRSLCSGLQFTVSQTLSECTDCGAGTYSTGGAFSCTPCPANTYSNATGARNSSTCQACPANSTTVVSIADRTIGVNLLALETRDAVDYYFASSVGADEVHGCLCNAGYSGPNGGPCTACAEGTFKHTFGSTECSSCVDDPTFSKEIIDFDNPDWFLLPMITMDCSGAFKEGPETCLQQVGSAEPVGCTRCCASCRTQCYPLFPSRMPEQTMSTPESTTSSTTTGPTTSSTTTGPTTSSTTPEPSVSHPEPTMSTPEPSVSHPEPTMSTPEPTASPSKLTASSPALTTSWWSHMQDFIMSIVSAGAQCTAPGLAQYVLPAIVLLHNFVSKH